MGCNVSCGGGLSDRYRRHQCSAETEEESQLSQTTAARHGTTGPNGVHAASLAAKASKNDQRATSVPTSTTTHKHEPASPFFMSIHTQP